jgi:hypothetical protein
MFAARAMWTEWSQRGISTMTGDIDFGVVT